MTPQAPSEASSATGGAPDAVANDARTAPTATWRHVSTLKGEDLYAWRVAPLPDRPTPDARNLQDEFPMGWFAVCYSDELEVGQVKAVRYFATEMAVWRGEDGKARVINAHCRHLGADMAHAGKVHGNYLECPFHAWRYDEEGAVKEIPYSRTIPPQAKRKDCVPHWETRELNGFVMIWYHPERIEPLWEPVKFEELDNPDWVPVQRFEWQVYNHHENIADNAVDISHFKFVHGTVNVPEYDFKYDGITRSVDSQVKLGTPRGEVNGAILSFTHGPGQGMVRFSGLTDTILVTGTTPVDRDITHSRYSFSQPKSEAEGPRGGLARALIKDLGKQFDQDKVILDRSVRVNQPLICEGDGPFARNTLYYHQFYASKGRAPKVAA